MTDTVSAALAAAAARLGADASSVLARLSGELRDSVLAASEDLDALDEATAKRRRAEIAALARSPSLAAARGVHPTWIEAALTELPARARTALAGQGTDATDVWLARWALARLPPMPLDPHAKGRGRYADLGRLIARDATELASWLRTIALDQLAFALGPAAASPDSPRELRLAAARIAKPPRAAALGLHRAALERCRGATLDDRVSLLRVAARALAPHLADMPLRRRQLTRRLAHAEGRAVEDELVAHATTPPDHAPSWAALTGPT